jgi:hypothetical protein
MFLIYIHLHVVLNAPRGQTKGVDAMSSSKPAPSCLPQRVAESEVGSVIFCRECERVTVSIGWVSVRLTLQAFGELSELLNDGQVNIQATLCGFERAAGTTDDERHTSVSCH